MRVKVVIEDGIVLGVLMDTEAKAAGLEVDIVDADSECDTDESVVYELSDPDMIQIDGTFTRHPKPEDQENEGNQI